CVVRSECADGTEVGTVEDWVIRPGLRTVPGTAEINGWGGLQKQYQVLVDTDRLLKYGVTFDQVVRALLDNNLNVGGGALDLAGELLLVSGVGRTATVAQIRAVPVTARQGGPGRRG